MPNMFQNPNTQKDIFGQEYSVPMYLQFVPGYCSEVVHSSESSGYGGEQTINSIFAIPHITDKFQKRKSLTKDVEFQYLQKILL